MTSITGSIAAADAIGQVESGAWLLDVREDAEWQAGHAPGAHHIPMGEIGRRQDELPADETILVICHVGGRSRLVTDALLAADYPAANVEGGMDAWQAAGGPVVR
jgi:rhodanese-related sulfurtransferase